MTTPEQKDWKEQLRLIWHKTDFNEKVTFIEKLLSSQAHALKERMKAKILEKKTWVHFDKVDHGNAVSEENILSAIESIEI